MPNAHPFVKDAINDAAVNRSFDLFEGKTEGTIFSPVYELKIPGGENHEIRLRLSNSKINERALTESFETLFRTSQNEADAFYNELCVEDANLKNIQRQAFAGMLWSKQYYNIDIPRWLI